MFPEFPQQTEFTAPKCSFKLRWISLLLLFVSQTLTTESFPPPAIYLELLLNAHELIEITLIGSKGKSNNDFYGLSAPINVILPSIPQLAITLLLWFQDTQLITPRWGQYVLLGATESKECRVITLLQATTWCIII